jgi:2-methylcitrate dehydratase PrpD
MAQFTESVLDFLQGEALSRPPVEAIETAVNGFTDCVAVMVAGRHEAVTQNLLTYVRSAQGRRESRLMLTSERSSASLSSLLGTASAHALDFDDYAFSNHVSALLVPSILAEADRGGASGAKMVEAYLAGFETWAAIFKREPDHLHSKGWHPTGVFGTLGVAAALCRLRGLDRAACRNALGLAATSGGGVMDNFGFQAKPYQGGRAAEAGAVCVELALRGVDAGPHALDGSGGLLAALSPRGKADLESAADSLGGDWVAAANSLNIKRHPTVGASQRTIDAAIQLHDDYRPAPQSIERVVARISEKHHAVMRFKKPSSAHEARFSLEFGVAAALIRGRVSLAELRDAFVGRDDVQSLIGRVAREIGPDDDPSYPVGALHDSVRLEMTDGTVLESQAVHRFLGHGENPMSLDQLREKFELCTRPHIGAAQSEALFDACRNLNELLSADAFPTLVFEHPE